MTPYKLIFTATAVCVVGMPPAFAQEATVPNEFSAGEEAVAAQVNENFQSLADAINSTTGVSQEPLVTGEYSIPRGTGGAKFGVLLADEGGNCWTARVFYENTGSETIDTPGGGTVTPDNIWKSANGCEGASELAWEYKYGIPDDTVGTDAYFQQTDGVEINTSYEGFTGGAFGYSQVTEVARVGDIDIVRRVELFRDDAGETVWMSNFSATRTLLDDPVTVGGETFDDVALVSSYGGSRTRIQARGVGVVKEVTEPNGITDPVFSTDSSVREIVFARNADGEIGDLSGTPFADGGAFGGIFH